MPSLTSKLRRECLAATAAGMDLVVSRFERDTGYPFVDTKLSTITGEDFPEASDPDLDFRGRGAVFGWIQGRGLEALAGHAAYLGDHPGLAARCDRMLDAVAARMAALGEAQDGRFFFLFTPDGRPFRCGADGRREFFDPAGHPPGFSDLFVGKGLAAAGARRGRADWLALGARVFRNATAAIVEGKFVSDQISFDPRNPATPVPGRMAQGPWMIALGGYALLCGLQPGEGSWAEGGAAFLDRLLQRHVVRESGGGLRRFDFVEWTDERGLPWSDGGRVIQDPGHAMEFTGLAARFLLNAAPRQSAGWGRLLRTAREELPEVFLGAFANGYRPGVNGICKTFDLAGREPVNDDMPWWPLPEAMRAAVLLKQLAPEHPRRAELEAAAETCGRALFGAFRSPVAGLFYQTRNARGEPAAVVPATPDADPGYHTGLCLIDVLMERETA